LKKSENCISF